MSKFDEKSTVPIFAVAMAGPVVLGFVFWLSTIYSSVINAEEINAAQDVKIERQNELLLEIRERLIRIETKLNK